MYIQQNNIGQLFDIEYLVSLTIRMFALLSQYSSQHVPFNIVGTNLAFNPAIMMADDWHIVISALWQALKSFLTFPQQHEFNIINDKFKVVKMKPLLPKDKKLPAQNKEKHPVALKSALRPSSPTTKVPSTKAATVKFKSKRVSPPSKQKDRTVAFVDGPIKYCIKDIARHYNIVTSLKPCKPNCEYVHYSQLPKNTSKADFLSSVDKIVTKLGLTDAQIQTFRSKIQDDNRFK